ncbi:MAG: AsmA family protein [Gallionella sp.]
MNKILKYCLIGTSAVVGIAAVGVAYVVLTFDPNDYKAQIIQSVKDSKQRNLRLDGDIKLSFYPSIGANLSKVSLSEFRSDKKFAEIESLRASLALIPLLFNRVVVDEVAVSGLQARLVKHRDGTSNIDDLLSQSEQQQEHKKNTSVSLVVFDIASVFVEKTNLSYRDEGSGAQYAIKELNLKIGRIAIGVPGKIELTTGIQANQPKLDLAVQLSTTLTFDLDKQRYQMQGLELQAGGAALDISNLKVKASGDVSADLTAQEFTAKKFALDASGIKVKENGVSASANVSGANVKQSGQSYKFEATLDAPSLSLTKDKYSGDKLTLNAKLDAAFGNVVASLTLPGVEGNAQSFKVSALSLDLDVKQPEQAFKVKLSSPLSGNIKAQQFNLSNLSVAVTATGDKLPNKSVSSEMKGSVQVDALKQTVQANLTGGLLQSQIKAKVGVKGFTDPAIKFDVDVDQFDADLYLPKKSSPAAKTQAKEPEQPLDLSALRKLNLDGSLRIGTLKVMNVKSTQLRVDVKALNGQVNINPLSAKLYQGSMNGSLSVNAQNTPSFAINQKFNGIVMAPLLKDAADLELAEGKGNIALDLTTQGNTLSAMKKALNGSVSVNLADGAIKGINLSKLVQGIQNLSMDTKAQTLGVDKSEKTEFSEFKANFKVRNGVAHNDDLAVKSTVLRISGNGDIDIGHDSINYNAKAALAKTEQGRTATLPVNVSGSFDALKFKVDYGALVADIAKQKFDDKKEQLKEDTKAKVQEQLRDKLKGLFK